jgi:hypothetical protein
MREFNFSLTCPSPERVADGAHREDVPMKKTLLITGLLALVIPGAAMAQPYDPGCVRSNENNTATGAVLGALGGALLGGAVAGKGHQGDGAAVGAVGGAVAGATIAGSQNHPCPSGYYYQGPPGPPPPPPPERRDFWYGAPEGVHERIDFMQRRVDDAIRGGWLSPREIRDIRGEMRRIREEDRRLEYQDGGRLTPPDHNYIEGLLTNLSQRLHWVEHYGR